MDRLKRPIINGELDAVTGHYWCPWGCGPTTNDPWEAMWHEVSHFCTEEEVEYLKQDYGPDKWAYMSCQFLLELTDEKPPHLEVSQGDWNGLE